MTFKYFFKMFKTSFLAIGMMSLSVVGSETNRGENFSDTGRNQTFMDAPANGSCAVASYLALWTASYGAVGLHLLQSDFPGIYELEVTMIIIGMAPWFFIITTPSES